MMESTVNTGMCRCCASEGAFKDIQSTYHWMGEEEVYSDMLRECFDIILNVSEQGQDGGICEVCITQLRNAINFKKQVLHTEEQFKKHLQNKTLFRPNIVKLEMPGDEDSDDNMGSGDDGFSGAEYEVPIKTEEDDPKPKKRAAAKASATTTRASAKKAKADNGESSSKRLGDTDLKIIPDVSKILSSLNEPRSTRANKRGKNARNQDEDDKLLKAEEPLKVDKTEIYKHLTNIRTIILHTNATPIRSHTGFGYMCAFCPKYFTKPADLKEHTLHVHDDKAKSTFMKGCAMMFFIVKLDITSLKCDICDLSIEGLEPLMDHLQYDHKKIMHRNIKNHIVPFKFEGDTLKCMLCSKVYEHFKLLLEHMNVHFQNYVCVTCNASFVNKCTFTRHLARHKQGEFSCQFCSKVFDTNVKKTCHEKFVHIVGQKRNKCPHCEEKFVSYSQRNEHMVKEHGKERLILKCKACDKTFTTRDNLTIHTKRDHLLERNHECQHCDKKFYRKKALKEHLLTHTGVKRYQCNTCLKAFGRRDHFELHMRIHNEDRRYRCDHCGLAFVHKPSWKSHMRSQHGEEV